eukprot:748100-Hanusia_phi.AAC.2
MNRSCCRARLRLLSSGILGGLHDLRLEEEEEGEGERNRNFCQPSRQIFYSNAVDGVILIHDVTNSISRRSGSPRAPQADGQPPQEPRKVEARMDAACVWGRQRSGLGSVVGRGSSHLSGLLQEAGDTESCESVCPDPDGPLLSCIEWRWLTPCPLPLASSRAADREQGRPPGLQADDDGGDGGWSCGSQDYESLLLRIDSFIDKCERAALEAKVQSGYAGKGSSVVNSGQGGSSCARTKVTHFCSELAHVAGVSQEHF